MDITSISFHAQCHNSSNLLFVGLHSYWARISAKPGSIHTHRVRSLVPRELLMNELSILLQRQIRQSQTTAASGTLSANKPTTQCRGGGRQPSQITLCVCVCVRSYNVCVMVHDHVFNCMREWRASVPWVVCCDMLLCDSVPMQNVWCMSVCVCVWPPHHQTVDTNITIWPRLTLFMLTRERDGKKQNEGKLTLYIQTCKVLCVQR